MVSSPLSDLGDGSWPHELFLSWWGLRLMKHVAWSVTVVRVWQSSLATNLCVNLPCPSSCLPIVPRFFSWQPAWIQPWILNNNLDQFSVPFSVYIWCYWKVQHLPSFSVFPILHPPSQEKEFSFTPCSMSLFFHLLLSFQNELGFILMPQEDFWGHEGALWVQVLIW